MNTTERIEETISEIAKERNINENDVTWHNIAVRLAEKLNEQLSINNIIEGFIFDELRKEDNNKDRAFGLGWEEAVRMTLKIINRQDF